MGGVKITGLRVFLLILLEMVSCGETETCESVKDAFADGVATMLFKKFPSYFNGLLDTECLASVNEYYKRLLGCADSTEFRKYSCKKDNGLTLLIALALNEIY